MASTPAAWRYSGWARRPRAELTEALQFRDGHAWFAARIEQRIKQHRAMAGGQDETVAVRPACGGGVIFEHLGEQHSGDIGGAHRQTRTTRFRLFHRVHGERANGIRDFLMGDFIFARRLQRFTLRAELARSRAIAASSWAAPCKSMVSPVWQPPKGLCQLIAYRKNDFAATYAYCRGAGRLSWPSALRARRPVCRPVA